MNMATMYTCQKENVQFNVETRKSLKKLQAAPWIQLPEKEWESKQLLLPGLVVIKVLVLVSS